jgi:hypothetical protein
MPEHRGHEVARRPVSAFIVFPHARCREGLQLVHRHGHGLLMRLDNPRVVADQRGDGNRFGRGKSEIVKYPAIGRLPFLAVNALFNPCRFLPECEPFASLRMKIIAEPDKLIGSRRAGQAQIRRALADPLAGDGLPFGVVIANRQVFLEILFGVNRVVLGFRCKHCHQLKRSGLARVSG